MNKLFQIEGGVMKNNIVEGAWDKAHSSTLNDVLRQVPRRPLSRGMTLHTPDSNLRADTQTSFHSDLSREYYRALRRPRTKWATR
jgi:hypothetical protein